MRLRTSIWKLVPFRQGWFGGQIWLCVREFLLMDLDLTKRSVPVPASTSWEVRQSSRCDFRIRGHRALHVREAVVKHIIRPHQVEPKWVIQRTYRLGRGEAAARWAVGKPEWTANRRLLQLVWCWLRAHLFRVCGGRDKWFRYACAAKFHQGYLVQQIHHKMQTRRRGGAE